MKTIPTPLLTHLQGNTTSMATCWKVTLQGSPEVIYGFTDHDQDISYYGVTYLASSGFLPTAVENQTRLAVDNLQSSGFLDHPVIDQQDLINGLWDYAHVEIFQLNWKDTTLGREVLVTGHLGEISVTRGKFDAELRGLASAFAQVRNKLYQPLCRATFGDAECGIDLADYTVTGTLEAVSADGLIALDSSRTEPGPTGTKAITNIDQNLTATITSAGHGFISGQLLYLSQIAGMTQLNGQFVTVQYADTDSFVINVDTRNYSPYVSGGFAAPQGSVGYFSGGKITMTSGASTGLSMEIKESAPGVMTLQLSFAQGIAAGDTYTMHAGCAKRFTEDCVAKYANGANFRGHPHLPGNNRVLQYGYR